MSGLIKATDFMENLYCTHSRMTEMEQHLRMKLFPALSTSEGVDEGLEYISAASLWQTDAPPKTAEIVCQPVKACRNKMSTQLLQVSKSMLL
ncbi:hypothetical protein JTB14_016456 [Gonioctena quinquepunctata]|nr:hypothetical protein JTB14_016456 [Gonioctena quinquepunctata]